MDKHELKTLVCAAIDRNAQKIIETGDWIWRNAEPGFREHKTAAYITDILRSIGLDPDTGIGITGVQAVVRGRRSRPNVAVMGELDALIIPEHPEAVPGSGAVHACGHNGQATNVVGLALGLVESGIMKELDGSVTLMAVPSEEPIEIEWRQKMRSEGRLFFLGGKQEFIKAGEFDDVDIAMIDHTGTEGKKIGVRGVAAEPMPGGDGFIAKMITFKGMEAHAGSAPWGGVNALNAAMLGIMGIHAQRETFKDSDAIRVHQILSKGGDSVNVVPSDIRMEMMVRGATIEAMKDACRKVDRALRGGAMAVGSEVDIVNIPGYLPSGTGRSLSLGKLILENAVSLLGEEQVATGRATGAVRVPGGGVSDVADVSAIVPTASIGVGGTAGRSHSRDFRIVDKETVYVTPAKIYAMTIVDLLCDGAAVAEQVIKEYKPVVPKKEYMDYWHRIMADIA